MSDSGETGATPKQRSTGYHGGGVDTVISVEEVNRQAAALAEAGVTPERVAALAEGEPYVAIRKLRAGYGKMEILHDFNLRVGKGQSLCLIGPNGAGKPGSEKELVIRECQVHQLGHLLVERLAP